MSSRNIGELCRSDNTCPEDYVCRKQGLLSRKRCRKRVIRNNTKKRKIGFVRRVGRTIKNKIMRMINKIKKKINKSIEKKCEKILEILKEKDPKQYNYIMNEVSRKTEQLKKGDTEVQSDLEYVSNMSTKEINRHVDNHLKILNDGQHQSDTQIIDQKGGEAFLIVMGMFMLIALLVALGKAWGEGSYEDRERRERKRERERERWMRRVTDARIKAEKEKAEAEAARIKSNDGEFFFSGGGNCRS